jgi:hypothetical protein
MTLFRSLALIPINANLVITQLTIKIEIWSRKTEISLIGVWHNGNLPQGTNTIFFFGKLTYVLKEEDTNIIRGIPQIYNDNRNIKQQMATG